MTMKLKPLHDRVVVKPIKEERSSGGIVIPSTAADRPIEGTVVAAGPGKMMENGNVSPLTVKKGQKVLFGKYSGTEMKISGEEYFVMREDDIMGIVEE
jgi:chaperonin GroES